MKTIREKTNSKTNEIFFDEVSSFYDGMIDFQNSLTRRGELLKNLIDKNITTVADLGCGTGIDSIALAKMGLIVTAFDQSSGMISRAKQNAASEGVKIQFEKSSLNAISKKYALKFDMTLSLGNTLANLEPAKLKTAVNTTYLLLKDKGKLVIQILNYYAILKKQERIINITRKNDFTFVRFYDFYPKFLNFNILTFNTEKPAERNLYTTKLYPYRLEDLAAMIRSAGFRKVKYFGSLSLNKYVKTLSGDLVIVAEK
ncbi:MAG: methyltransferase domain-containing protein [Bacteroidota bacterium]|nr:methyltransferase domain-containing protein [Bacteroidota bacterium]